MSVALTHAFVDPKLWGTPCAITIGSGTPCVPDTRVALRCFAAKRYLETSRKSAPQYNALPAASTVYGALRIKKGGRIYSKIRPPGLRHQPTHYRAQKLNMLITICSSAYRYCEISSSASDCHINFNIGCSHLPCCSRISHRVALPATPERHRTISSSNRSSPYSIQLGRTTTTKSAASSISRSWTVKTT